MTYTNPMNLPIEPIWIVSFVLLGIFFLIGIIGGGDGIDGY